MSIPWLILLLLLAVPSSGLTLLFDMFIASAMVRQIRALGYATALGTITHSSVVTDDGDEEGGSYRFDIRYDYRVDDSQYYGTRYRYGADANFDRGGHHRILASYPVGSQVEVYYAPNDPADAVLRAGVDASDLVITLPMLPFNLAMLGLWLGLFSGIRSRLWPRVAGRVKLSQDRRYLRVWLDHWTPLQIGLVAGAIVSGFLAFLVTLIVAFGFGCYPHVVVPLAGWGIVLGGGGFACRFVCRKAAQTDCELVIDNYARTVVLPRSFGRPDHVTIPWHRVRSIEVDRVECRNASEMPGGNYVPTMTVEDGNGLQRRERLVQLLDLALAERLADWLCEQLAVRRSPGAV
jgi:hypothetical protein